MTLFTFSVCWFNGYLSKLLGPLCSHRLTTMSSSKMTKAGSLSSADSPMLPNEVAADLLQRFSKGIRRCRLSELAVGSLNRPISAKYVHHRLRVILEVYGFTKLRYHHATALEPNPADPLAGAKRTNREADMSCGMLPSVTWDGKLELVTKNHLFSAFLMRWYWPHSLRPQ